jgi:hypothetical protein
MTISRSARDQNAFRALELSHASRKRRCASVTV